MSGQAWRCPCGLANGIPERLVCSCGGWSWDDDENTGKSGAHKSSAAVKDGSEAGTASTARDANAAGYNRADAKR